MVAFIIQLSEKESITLENKTASEVMLIMLLASILSLAFDMRFVKASSQTNIYVLPSSSTAEPSDHIIVAIMIENVPDPGAAAWQFKLRFDPSVLTITNPSYDIQEGAWLSQYGLLSTYFIATTPSYYVIVSSFLTEPGATTGSGTLACITFKVIDPGYTTLELRDTKLWDPNLQPITHTANDGEFYTNTPVADFIVSYGDSDLRNPVVDETITFNAAYNPMTKRGSYDPNPGGEITSYRWDFGDGTIKTYVKDVNLTAITTHSYAQPELYMITLTVTDNSVPSLTDSWSKPLVVSVRDIAITNIEIAPAVAVSGTIVAVNVTVTNLGTEAEYFNVTLYYDNTLIWYNITEHKTAFCLPLENGPGGIPPAPSLLPGDNIVISYAWNTGGISEGQFTIRANASIVVSAHRFDQFFVGVEDETNNSAESTIIITSSPVVTASVDIDSDTLNLKSNGKWITAYIQLPEAYDPAKIDVTTISLNGTIMPVLDPKYEFVTSSSEYLVDHDGDGILERMVKFDQASVESFIRDHGTGFGNAALTLTGKLLDGTPFEGTDIIVVNKPFRLYYRR